MLSIQCVRHLRRSVRELSSGMPVSALSALMAAQNAYARYVMSGGFSLRTVRTLQRCIRSVEDRVYPVIDLRGRVPRERSNDNVG